MNERKVAMCLMAHPDDCEILVAGTLALLASRDWEIHVVTMTPGDGGSMTLSPLEIAAKRRQEAANAAAILGAQYHCLESRDLYVTYDEITMRRAMALTRHIQPSLVITHSLVDYIVDHEETAKIARNASFGSCIPNSTPGVIDQPSSIPHLYYADPIEGVDVYGDAIRPTTLVNISETMSIKTSMLAAHESQRNWLREHHGIDEYILSMQNWNRLRGEVVDCEFAEGFRQHLGHGYPRDCLLSRELGSLVTKHKN